MIKETINRLKSELPAAVKLVAVSKFHPLEAIIEAYEAGQRIFAESRPQELAAKVAQIDALRASKIAEAEACGGDAEAAKSFMTDIEWHFIGHLQTNKLKMVLPHVSLVQSVDSLRLLEAMNRWGEMNGKLIDVLIEPHVAAEETKQGFSADEVSELFSSDALEKFGNIRFRGIMGMATFTDDETIIRSDFARLRDIFDKVRGQFPALAPYFTELSIGMSDDYPLAVTYGSTMVRIGSLIFGSRK